MAEAAIVVSGVAVNAPRSISIAEASVQIAGVSVDFVEAFMTPSEFRCKHINGPLQYDVVVEAMHALKARMECELTWHAAPLPGTGTQGFRFTPGVRLMMGPDPPSPVQSPPPPPPVQSPPLPPAYGVR